MCMSKNVSEETNRKQGSGRLTHTQTISFNAMWSSCVKKHEPICFVFRHNAQKNVLAEDDMI